LFDIRQNEIVKPFEHQVSRFSTSKQYMKQLQRVLFYLLRKVRCLTSVSIEAEASNAEIFKEEIYRFRLDVG
jgi:hypothetical protein